MSTSFIRYLATVCRHRDARFCERPDADVRTSLRRSSSERRRLTATYCSCREPHQPEKLFPDQIRQWPNIDRWKATFIDARARARASREGPSFSSLSSAIDSRDLTCDSRGPRDEDYLRLIFGAMTFYPVKLSIPLNLRTHLIMCFLRLVRIKKKIKSKLNRD